MEFDEAGNRERIKSLRWRGVDVWGPERVYISPDVDLAAVEAGSVIRQATLSGPDVRIARGARVGVSGHAEIHDCQIGEDVELGAGLYRGATFLTGVKVRGFAEIRPGTLLEERAETAHSVALKNTTLTACCVAGSLINFCDLFMSGGTSRSDHSEVGSGVVHYNFDPRGDKWGSLIGDVRGVLLRSAPIFIGGGCGIAGPVHIGFGAVTAAGATIRHDIGENVVVFDNGHGRQVLAFDRRIYRRLRRKFHATAKLIGTLWALDIWYQEVRCTHASSAEKPFYEAARRQIAEQIEERIRCLGRIVQKLPRSIELSIEQGESLSSAVVQEQRILVETWDDLRRVLRDRPDPAPVPSAFLDAYSASRGTGKNHLEAVRTADTRASEAAEWLDGLVQDFTERAHEVLQRVSAVHASS